MLAEKMQKEIRLKSRRHKWRWFPDCFRGSEAVTWLMEKGEVASREMAVGVGAEMLGRGLIFHVTHRNGFQDKKDKLYRFNCSEGSSEWDESDAASVSSSVSMAPKRVMDNYDHQWSRRAAGTAKNSSARGDKWSIGKEMTSLQGRVLDLDLDIEDQKEMQGILLDAISAQMRGMQTITGLLQAKIVSANARVADLELWLAASAALQVVFLLWYAGFPILATGFLVLAGNVGYIWHQSREPSVAGMELEGEEGEPCDGQWSQADWSWTGRRVSGDRPYSGEAAGGHRGWEEEVADSSGESDAPSASRTQLPAAPSMTIRRIREETSRDFQRMLSRSASVNDNARSSPEGHSLSVPDHHLQRDDAGARAGRPRPPTQKEISDSSDAPLLVRPTAGLPYQICANLADGQVPLNTGRRLHFETDSFKGCAVLWVQGLPSSPSDLFSNRNRKTSITVQGRFKRPSGLEDICTGQEFSRTPVNLPARWLVDSVLVKIVRSISPSMSIGPLSKPYLLVPMVAAAQIINVALPGDEPDPSREIPENMTLYDDTLVDQKGSPLMWSKRQKVFRDAKMRKDRVFTEEHVWTFTMYQSQVNLASYVLDVGLRFDLATHLDGQPLQFMMKDRSRDSYLFNFEAWHEKLLPAAHAAWQASQETP